MRKLIQLITIAVLFFTVKEPLCEEYIQRARRYPESWYQEIWCDAHNGLTEVYLTDNTRADCVTSTHVIEFDFADKWYESIAQSLHYALHYDKIRQPGIVLIIEDSSIDEKFWNRLNNLLDAYHMSIDTWKYGVGITEVSKERLTPIIGDINSDNRIGLEEAIHALQHSSYAQ